jgi:3-deoxy-7-phosphoheptulonate synthase
VAVDAILTARERHLFPSLTKEGAPAILETSGNPYGHLVLRGGSETGPNYAAPAVDEALRRLKGAGLPEIVMIDCSHGNSEKNPLKQVDVVADVIDQLRGGQRGIRALMLESHLVAGRQAVTDRPLVYGQSVTDACLGFEQTAELIRRLAGAI